jgi:hypothetical protein
MLLLTGNKTKMVEKNKSKLGNAKTSVLSSSSSNNNK